MDVIAELKAMKCDPGPVHSPNECTVPEPCPCQVQAAAAAEIARLRKALEINKGALRHQMKMNQMLMLAAERAGVQTSNN